MRLVLKTRLFLIVPCLLLWAASFIASIAAEVPKGTTAQDHTVSRVHTLTIGKVSNNPKKHYKHLKPMVDYMASRLQDLGINNGEVLMAKDKEQMIQFLRNGEIDWVTETPFSALIFSEQAGAEIILRTWKKGQPSYYTVFITRKDGRIRSLEDLKGKMIAFEDPGSTTAYYVPASVLLQEGLELTQLSSPREKPAADKVGYAFAGQEINIATWVYRGLADAGAYSNLDWNDEEHTPEALKKDLTIFHQTRPFPRAVELVRKDLDPQIKKAIKDTLLHAHTEPEGRAALKAYQKTARFDEFTGEAQAGLEEARRILKAMHAVAR